MQKKNLPKTFNEYKSKYNEIKKIWKKNLKNHGVNLPRLKTAKSFWLVALYCNLKNPIGNTEIYNWMLTFKIFQNKIPPLKSDQQIRHLGMQDGWDLKGLGYEYKKNNQIKKLKGEYILMTTTRTFPSYVLTRRNLSKLKSKNFRDLKNKTGNICLTCWNKEGLPHPKTGKKISLQKGHMNPNKRLSISNTIPQCAYCNQTYKNKFIFGKDGRIIGINDISLFYNMDPIKIKNDISLNPFPNSIKRIINEENDYEK